MTNSITTSLLAVATTLALASSPAFAANGAAVDAEASAAAAGEGDSDQGSTRQSAGQANDANSLTTSDIIVTGTKETEKAPSIASLATTQPQAAVSQTFIDKSAALTSDFYQLAALTPGVTVTGGNNGVGLGESKMSIRGFQDGEYNVTYDSIPFGDTNNPTHHSTAFFRSNTIETLVVDRGPGNASQLGQATYGGNVNLYSKSVDDAFGIRADATIGSFETYVGRLALQTGRIDKLGGAKFVLSGQVLDSQGALTYSPTHSKNIFAKGVIPIGTANTLTVLATYNANVYYQSDSGFGTCGTGATSGNIDGDGCTTGALAVYGKRFGNTNDPSPTNKYAQDYWAYNRTAKQTDFEIVRLQSDLGSGLTLDNRVYMYGYTNHTLSGQDGTGATANTVVLTPGGGKTAGVPGYDKLNKYRTVGYIGQADYNFSHGRLRLGGWYEHASTDRHLLDLNLTTMQPNYIEGTVKNVTVQPPANVNYIQHSGWDQFQLFGEFEYRPFEGLSITPGVKYVNFTRSIDAQVNQKSRTPINAQATWDDVLPFLTANYQIRSDWTTYFQYAKGMYVPDLSSFYSPSSSLLTSLADLQPQRSTNWQAGTVYHGRHFAIDADAYMIEVNNKIAAPTVAGSDSTLLVNIGKVKYKGVEGQLSVFPVTGLTLFANASYNSAKSGTTHEQIAKTPFATGAVGVFYDHDGFFASYTHKFTGAQYATEADTNAPFRLYRLSPYSIGSLAVGYDFRRFRVSVNVYNVFDDDHVIQVKNSSKNAPTVAGIDGKAVQSGYGPNDQLQFNAPRSVQATVSVRF